MKRVVKVCFILLASLLVIPLGACGGAPPPPPPPPAPPAVNQPPVINSLTAEAASLIPNMETKITCVATDPDNDNLTYTWTNKGGDITNTYGNIIFWRAPNFVGDCSVSVSVDDGKGHTVSRSLDLKVVANRAPVINSLTPVPAKLQRGENSTITCNALDPDGDILTYSWTVSGGTLSGTGPTVIWKAPDTLGSFEIKVTVGDGKGGTVNSSCAIVVATPEITLILTPISGESGTITSDGDITQDFKIGDTANNKGLRPYFSFDISGLTGAEIKQARLNFTVRQTVGYPFTTLTAFLYVDSMDLPGSPRPLRAADFYLPSGGEMAKLNQQPPSEINAYERLTIALHALKPRFQVRLRLGEGDTGSNMNRLEDFIEFSKVELTVVYTK